ncbi:Vegetative incompatibility protein HET-E-1 [Durusdinium trenchii]|uniref:Vegetative incompatibility protein HET-E-1 n=1 Tax=Durusdinium trenchii TaxID=1381693 RepID=A0ABP0HGW2_9DINO
MPRGTHVHVCCAHAPRAQEEQLQEAWGKQQAALVVALRHALPDREVTCTGAGGEVDVEQVGLVVVCASQRLVDAVNERQGEIWTHWSALVVRKQLPFVLVVVEPEASQEHWTGGFALHAGRAAAVADLTGEEKGIVEDAVAQIVQHVEPEEEVDQQGSEDDLVFALDGFDPLQLVREKSALYVEGTRAWAKDEFRAWANRSASVWASDRVLVFVGPAGFGKSVLMARICDENGLLDDDDDDDDGVDEASSPARKKKRRSIPLLSMLGGKKTQEQTVVKVRAAHFFKHDDKQACNLKTCLLSVANQLAAVLPVYRDEIAKLDKDEILHGLGPAVLFDRLIAEPMSKVPEPSEIVVVLLDALDEVTEADRGVLLHIVRNLWHTKTPEWLGLVLSTRPEDPIRDTLEVFRPTVLQLDDERNLSDLRHFLETRLRRHLAHVDRDLERAVDILAQRTEGLFLYAYFVDQTLVGRESKVASLGELEEVFPDGGIDDMYQSYFSRLLEGPLHGDQELYGVLLGTLVAARSPVPRDVLQAAVRVESVGEFDEILARSEQLLAVGPDTVRFIHKSMSDFVQDRRRAGGRLVVDPGFGHQHVARMVIEDPEFMRSSSFLLRHALFHLQEANKPDAVAEWLFDFRNLHSAAHWVDVFDIVQDFLAPVKLQEKLPENHPRRLQCSHVVRALELAAPALRHDPDELAGQIVGRVRDVSHPLRLSMAHHWKPIKPWLRPVSAECLKGAEIGLRRALHCPDRVVSLAISHDGTIVAVALHRSSDVVVWDAILGVESHTLSGHEDHVKSVAMSANGEIVVSGSWDSTMRIWDRGSQRHVIPDWDHYAFGELHVSSDGKVVLLRRDDSVRLLNAESGLEMVQFYEDPDGYYLGVVLSGNGKVVVGASALNDFVRIWDARTGELIDSIPGAVRDVAISSNGTKLASVGDWSRGVGLSNLRMWDVVSGHEIWVIQEPSLGLGQLKMSSDGSVVAYQILFGSGVLVSGDTFRIRDTDTGAVLWTRCFGVSHVVCLAGCGSVLASAAMTLHLWEWEMNSTLHNSTAAPSCFPDGLVLWLAISSEVLASARMTSQGSDVFLNELSAVMEGWYSSPSVEDWLTISSNKRTVLSITIDTNGIRLWACDVDKGVRLLVSGSLMLSPAVSASGSAVAVALKDNSVRLCDVTTGEETFSWRGHLAKVVAIAVSDDGRVIAAAAFERHKLRVRVWDVHNRKLMTSLFIKTETAAPSPQLACSSDCLVVLYADIDDLIRRSILTMRDAKTGEERWTVRRIQTWPLGSRRLSPVISCDGKTLMTHGNGESVSLRDAATGRERSVVVGTGRLLSFAFSDSSATVAIEFSRDSSSLGSQVEFYDAMSGVRLKDHGFECDSACYESELAVAVIGSHMSLPNATGLTLDSLVTYASRRGTTVACLAEKQLLVVEVVRPAPEMQ